MEREAKNEDRLKELEAENVELKKDLWGGQRLLEKLSIAHAEDNCKFIDILQRVYHWSSPIDDRTGMWTPTDRLDTIFGIVKGELEKHMEPKRETTD